MSTKRPTRKERKLRKIQCIKRIGDMATQEVKVAMWKFLQELPDFERIDWESLPFKVLLDVKAKTMPFLRGMEVQYRRSKLAVTLQRHVGSGMLAATGPLIRIYKGREPEVGEVVDKKNLLATFSAPGLSEQLSSGVRELGASLTWDAQGNLMIREVSYINPGPSSP